VAGPLAALGGFLIAWAAVSVRPEHAVSRLFYRQYRWRDGPGDAWRPWTGIPMRAPRRVLLLAASIFGVIDIALAAAIAILGHDDPTTFGLIGITIAVQLVVLLALSLWPRRSV